MQEQLPQQAPLSRGTVFPQGILQRQGTTDPFQFRIFPGFLIAGISIDLMQIHQTLPHETGIDLRIQFLLCLKRSEALPGAVPEIQ